MQALKLKTMNPNVKRCIDCKYIQPTVLHNALHYICPKKSKSEGQFVMPYKIVKWYLGIRCKHFSEK